MAIKMRVTIPKKTAAPVALKGYDVDNGGRAAIPLLPSFAPLTENVLTAALGFCDVESVDESPPAEIVLVIKIERSKLAAPWLNPGVTIVPALWISPTSGAWFVTAFAPTRTPAAGCSSEILEA